MYHVTGDDSVGLSGRRVMLHEVRGPEGATLDSTRTDRSGSYLFSIPAPDTSARYAVSVEYDDIGYFSSAVPLMPGGAETVPTIVVYDTSFSDPAIVLHERHIIVRNKDVDGTRQIIELLTLSNGGRLTRIAADTSNPVWQGVLPAGATQLAIGESEVGAGAVYGRAGQLAIAAPIPPGEKQLLFSYVVPPTNDRLQFPIDQPIVRFTISLEDTTAAASGGAVVLYGVEQVGGTVFKRYDAGNFAATTTISVQFQTALITVDLLKIVLVAAFVFVLAGTLTWYLKKQQPKTAP